MWTVVVAPIEMAESSPHTSAAPFVRILDKLRWVLLDFGALSFLEVSLKWSSRSTAVAVVAALACAVASPAFAGPADLDDPVHKDHAMQIVSSAENSSQDWRAQFAYIEDIHDGRGYTAGIIGFTSGTHDMLELVQRYTDQSPNNVLAPYLPALRAVDGTDSHEGLDPGFQDAWRQAATDKVFCDTQESERDRVYFDPAVSLAKQDGLRALGQFAYYDAAVVHGYQGLQAIRSRALGKATTPAQGGDETAYLNAFLDERVIEMKKEPAHEDTTRIDTAQRVWLQQGNFDLTTPLRWQVYGKNFEI